MTGEAVRGALESDIKDIERALAFGLDMPAAQLCAAAHAWARNGRSPAEWRDALRRHLEFVALLVERLEVSEREIKEKGLWPWGDE